MDERQPKTEWEAAAFDREKGEWVHTTLHSYEHTPDVSEQSFISQAAPTIIRPTRRQKPQRRDSLTLVGGDAQIGFRGGEAFHCERSLGQFILAVSELQPDNVVFTGDMLDLPAMSRYEQRSDWQHTTQAAIDRYHTFLAEVRANAPNANIVVVEGNHEKRQDTMIRRDAAALLGLRRANADELAVLTIPFLARFEELEVQNISGYPNGTYWLEDNLKAMHGWVAKKGGATAASYLRSEQESTIYGHDHRLAVAYRTIPQRMGHFTLAAASPGCLCRVDGAVPGVGYSINDENQMVPRAQDWQNGLLVVSHNERVHDITPVKLSEEGMNLLGRVYEHGNR